MRRQVTYAQGAKYSGEISGGIVDKLDKGLADGAGPAKGQGVGTDDGAGLAEDLP